jgi:alpha-mannosidase
VASHHWIDLTDRSGSFGETLLTDVKNGSDKRDDHTLRLTLVRTPGLPLQDTAQGSSRRRGYTDQLNQDWGHHEILYGIVGHSGDWRQGKTQWQAYRMSTPLLGFATEKHAGPLGRSFSLASVNDSHIRILALKKAELGDEVIARLVEMDGRPAPDVRLKFAGPITAARELNGQELPLGSAMLKDGVLQTSFNPYQPRTFALRLGTPPAHLKEATSEQVELKYDLAAASHDDTKSTGGFDAKGDALPAEMLPSEVNFDEVKFHLAPSGEGKLNAIVAKGQTIKLPSGEFNRVYVLAASCDGDQRVSFHIGTQAEEVIVQDWTGFIGQWDTRLWKPAPDTITIGGNESPARQVALRKDWAVSANHATWNLENRGSPDWAPSYPEDYVGLRPGYIKRAPLAWYASHYHTPDGLNQPYAYSYLFAYPFSLPPHTQTLTLPDNDKIRILAISVAREDVVVTPEQPLYDTLDSAGLDAKH